MRITIGCTDFHPHVFAELLYNSGISTNIQHNHPANVHLKATLMYVRHARKKKKDDVEFWCAEKKKDGLWMAFRMQSYLPLSTKQYGLLQICKHNISL